MLTSMIERYRPLMMAENEGGGGGAAPSSPAPSESSGAPTAPAPASAGAGPSSPASPGAGAPSAPPTAQPSPKTPLTPDVLDFASIFDPDLRAPEVPPSLEAAPAAPKPAPAAPAATPTPPAAPTPPAQPVAGVAAAAEVQPAAPVAPAPGQQPPGAAPAAPQLDPYSPGELGQRLTQHEAEAIEHLAGSVFKLSAEEIEALEADVVGTVPKLLAKAFVKSQQVTLGQMARMMPVMIQRQTEALRQNAEHENKFFTRWPDIKKVEHGQLLQRYAATYRQMNPNATADEMIEHLGPMIMMAAKIVPTLQPQVAAPGVAPANPMAQPTVVPSNGRPPPPSAFVPAGAGPVSNSQAQELAPWEAIHLQQE